MADDNKRIPILDPQRAHLAQHVRQYWVMDAEEGTKIDDVLDPGYWAHIAPRLSRLDRVTVHLETGEWMLDLLVVDKDRNWAKMHVLHHYDLTKASEAVASPEAAFEVKWGGPHYKFRVIRRADKEVLSSGHADAEAGRAWLRAYEQTVATT
jgi:hypothetical protein